MTAPTLPHRRLRPTAPAVGTEPGRLSTVGWARLRRRVTAAVFIVATVAGVTVGIRAVDVSPVASPLAIGLAAPEVGQQPAAAVVQPTAPAVGRPGGDMADSAGPRAGSVGRLGPRGGGNGGRR